jgi:uncharacterized protein Usg
MKGYRRMTTTTIGCAMFEYDGVVYVWDEYDMLVPQDELDS